MRNFDNTSKYSVLTSLKINNLVLLYYKVTLVGIFHHSCILNLPKALRIFYINFTINVL